MDGLDKKLDPLACEKTWRMPAPKLSYLERRTSVCQVAGNGDVIRSRRQRTWPFARQLWLCFSSWPSTSLHPCLLLLLLLLFHSSFLLSFSRFSLHPPFSRPLVSILPVPRARRGHVRCWKQCEGHVRVCMCWKRGVEKDVHRFFPKVYISVSLQLNSGDRNPFPRSSSS